MKKSGTKSGSRTEAGAHRWRFFRAGGVDQVIIDSGDDIAALERLDLKLWMALAMPTTGISFDAETAALVDSDGDGRIRPDELLAVVAWAKGAFKDLSELIPGSDSVALASIRDPALLASAESLVAALGKAGSGAVTLEDVRTYRKAYAGGRFNGDGVVPAESADDPATRAAIEDIVAATGGVPDLSGKRGVDAAALESFFAGAEATLAWSASLDASTGALPLEQERMERAAAATLAVEAKIEDFFTRCRVAAFDPRGGAALNVDDSHYKSMASMQLSDGSAELGAVPLALVAPGADLPLGAGLNPAWRGRIGSFRDEAAVPLLGRPVSALSESDWASVRKALEPYRVWASARPAVSAASLGIDRLRRLVGDGSRGRVAALIERDAALAPEGDRLGEVEKLVRLKKDLYTLLRNYVNFAAFYGREGAIFQLGTLYLDSRACGLCLAVSDEARHASLAGLSGAFLVYCDLSRSGGQKRRIVAAMTGGDSDSLMVGRNGVFYDLDGLDWDATITRLVQNPISVRQAFWSPYKQFARMVEEQIAKRAQAGEASSQSKLSSTAETLAGADIKGKEAAAALPAKKIDLGTIALIGTAIGGVSALVAGFLQSLFSLGIWLPVGLVAMVLLISGPSMILASLKLRKRNIGPMLDANGWAINTQARVNIPFGAALTDVAALPPGSIASLADPFAEKKSPWQRFALIAALVVVAVAAMALAWRLGWADALLPEAARYSSLVGR